MYERGLTLKTAATSLPVGVDEFKTRSRIDATDEDAHLMQLLRAATDEVQTYLGRALITQTWTFTLDAFPAEIQVPLPPLSSVTSIKYYDGANAQQTLSSSLYDIVNATPMNPATIRPTYGKSWPTTYGRDGVVEVEFIAGYGAEADVPWSIKQRIYVRAAQHYEHRETETKEMLTLASAYKVARF